MHVNDYIINLLNFFDYHAVSPVVMVVQPPPIVVDTMVTLMCNVTEGNAPYNITWIFGSPGDVVYTGDETTGGFFTLMITSADYGAYTCRAINEFGMNSSVVEIIQAG